MQDLGLEVTDLLAISVDLYAADKRKMEVLGVIPVFITTKKDGSEELVEI